MGYGIDILNQIRVNASEDYQNRIPEATQGTISSIGYAFENYKQQFNEFHSNLLEKIGLTIVEYKMYKNRLAKFKSGKVSPHDIEEIFMEMAKAEGQYDKTGPNPLGRRENPPVHVMYHRQNREDYYAISIGNIDFRKVFSSEATFEAFVKGKINSVYSGDERDEFLLTKNLLATFEVDLEDGSKGTYFDYEVKENSDMEKFAKDFIKTVKKAVLDCSSDVSREYNAAGVETQAKASDLVLFVLNDVLVETDVELLMSAFNTSYGDPSKVVNEVVPMKDFGSMTDAWAILVDKEWFRIYDTLFEMEPQRNAQGLFTNYFLHHHQIISASPFKTAIKFKKVSA